MTGMVDLETVEARIWSILEPYRADLEPATIYGMPSLRWPGAKAHDYFAAVRAGKSYVSLYLLVADRYPEALAGAPNELLKRRSCDLLQDAIERLAEDIPEAFDGRPTDTSSLIVDLTDQPIHHLSAKVST